MKNAKTKKRGRLIRKPIVCASDCIACPDCGEAYCKKHRMHYADCPCIGPHNAEELGYEVVEIKGNLYAEKRL